MPNFDGLQIKVDLSLSQARGAQALSNTYSLTSYGGPPMLDDGVNPPHRNDFRFVSYGIPSRAAESGSDSESLYCSRSGSLPT